MTPMTHVVAVWGRGVVAPDEPVVTVDDLGLRRGDGCFDSLRAVRDSSGRHQPVDLDEHLDRLAASAAALGIDGPPREDWRGLVAEALAAWPATGEATVTLVLTRGRDWTPGPATAFVTVSPVADRIGAPPRLTVVRLSRGHPSDAHLAAPWLLGGVKTLSYAVNSAARREARRRGADDVIFTSTDGFVLDAPTAGVLVARGDQLRSTPVAGTGILASTSVAGILDRAPSEGLSGVYALEPAADLTTADGVWLVSSSRGPCPVTAIDGEAVTVDEELVTAVNRLAGF